MFENDDPIDPNIRKSVLRAAMWLVKRKNQEVDFSEVIPFERLPEIRHFMDPPPPREPPTAATLVRAIMKQYGWTQTELSRRSGIHVQILGGLLRGTQAGLYLPNQYKLRKVVEGDGELLGLYNSIHWPPVPGR